MRLGNYIEHDENISRKMEGQNVGEDENIVVNTENKHYCRWANDRRDCDGDVISLCRY